MASVRVPRFTPSVNGFPFTNAWPSNPIRQFKLGNVATLNIGDAANGLCGGMSFTLGDLHRAGLPTPADPAPPAGSARYNYIVDRQITSFDDGKVPWRFYSLMSPTRPAREPAWAPWLGFIGLDRHSRTYVMIHEEWPAIRGLLDSGQLAMIGLVRVVSARSDATGAQPPGRRVRLRPRRDKGDHPDLRSELAPGRVGDDHLRLKRSMGSITPTWSKPDAQLVCFFHAPYTQPTQLRSVCDLKEAGR